MNDPSRTTTSGPADERTPDPSSTRNGVVEVRPWPRRTALVLGAVPRRSVLETLRLRGFGTAVAVPDRGDAVAATLSPFTFLVVSPDVLATDAGVELLRRMHRCSPSACLLLDAPAHERTVDVLLRAVRAGVSDVVDADDDTSLAAAIDTGLAIAGRHRERVLAIGAHPDDVEIGCAGTLLDHRLRGDRVSILTLSRGAVGGDRERRLREAASAAEAIGAQLVLGDLPDTLIEDGAPTIRLIEHVVAQVDPTVVYVHSQHDDHQDHRAVARAAASATRRVRRVFAYQSPSATNHFRPTRFVTIDAVVQRKVQVLMMFDSQNGRSYLEPELVVAGSRYWARHVATEARYAEPFEQLRSTGDLRHADSPPIADAAATQPAFDLPAFGSVRRFATPSLGRPA